LSRSQQTDVQELPGILRNNGPYYICHLILQNASLGGGLSYLKDRNRDRLGDGDERDVTNISETFKVEKKIRDEEEEMNKYIENELLKRRGIESAAEKSNTFEVKKLSEILDPKSLYELPEVINMGHMYII